MTQIKTVKTEKRKNPNPMEKQNCVNWTPTKPSITKQMLTQEEKINTELIKKVMTENKTTLSSKSSQDWKKVKQIITKYSNGQYSWKKQALRMYLRVDIAKLVDYKAKIKKAEKRTKGTWTLPEIWKVVWKSWKLKVES